MRWRTGHVQRSVARHLYSGLTSLGWFDDPARYTETPFVWEPDHDPDAVAAGNGPAKPNTIGLSIGDVPDILPQELGGGLQSQNIPVFVDIYAEKRGIARNLGDDVQGILQGEVWAPSRYVPFYDFSASTPTLVTDQAIEARGVEARWPVGAGDWRRRWRVVSFTAVVYWTGAGND